MKKKRLLQLMMFLAITTLVLTACSTGDSPVDAPDAAAGGQVSQDAIPVPDEASSANAASTDGDEQPEMGSDEAAESVEPPPEPRTELEATDPSTVMLASGSPQLVEFFAYW